jgi:hypothetical protein
LPANFWGEVLDRPVAAGATEDRAVLVTGNIPTSGGSCT